MVASHNITQFIQAALIERIALSYFSSISTNVGPPSPSPPFPPSLEAEGIPQPRQVSAMLTLLYPYSYSKLTRIGTITTERNIDGVSDAIKNPFDLDYFVHCTLGSGFELG